MAQTDSIERVAVQSPANITNDNLHNDSGSQPVKNDSLDSALQSMKTFSKLEGQLPLYPPAAKDTANDIQAARDAANEAARQAQAAAAKNKLAQEALLANPAEIRALFPTVYQDVSINHNGYLDMSEITQGLNNANLPQTELNVLTVLKEGYKEFSHSPVPSVQYQDELPIDPEGVSAGGLAVVDKAVNRGISEDPYYWGEAKVGPEAFIPLAILGAGVAHFYQHADPREAIILGVGAAAVITIGLEGLLLYQKYGGSETKLYDNVKTDYLSFVHDYEKGQSGSK